MLYAAPGLILSIGAGTTSGLILTGLLMAGVGRLLGPIGVKYLGVTGFFLIISGCMTLLIPYELLVIVAIAIWPVGVCLIEKKA